MTPPARLNDLLLRSGYDTVAATRMENILTHSVTVFAAFFAIMNPIAGVPVFLGLTSSDDEQTTRAVAFRSLFFAFAVVLVFSVAGKLIFDAFGLTLPAFRITGGIIVFFIGLHMIQGKQSSVQHPSEEEKRVSRDEALGVAITPLGMPLLAGPGTIATAMNFSAGGGISEVLVTVLAFGVLCLITYFAFVSGEKLVRYVGTNALGVVTRMMGLVLATIGTQMVIEGLRTSLSLPG